MEPNRSANRHGSGTRLMVAGCLLLGAGFLIKLDATGPHGNFLDCNYGGAGCFREGREWG